MSDKQGKSVYEKVDLKAVDFSELSRMKELIPDGDSRQIEIYAEWWLRVCRTDDCSDLRDRLEAENAKLDAALMLANTLIRWHRNPEMPDEQYIAEIEASLEDLRKWQRETIAMFAPLRKEAGLL